MDDGVLLGEKPALVPRSSLSDQPSQVALDGRTSVGPRRFGLADVVLEVSGADDALVAELTRVLGPECAPQPHAYARCAAQVAAATGSDYGRLLLDARANPAADLLLGLETAGAVFERLPGDAPGEFRFAFRGERNAIFAIAGPECRFRREPRAALAVALLLYHHMLALRDDALFFHAAAVGIRGRGLMIVGPKGAGKSTLALALAARGYLWLGDETACFVPARGELVPCRRPAGIKPGPRSALVEAALRRAGLDTGGAGLRIPLDSFLPLHDARPLPLGAVLFLTAFEAAPRLLDAAAGRDELARLQPSVSSLGNASAGRRVFEMARLLSSVRTYRLAPGAPDATADLVAAHFERTWA